MLCNYDANENDTGKEPWTLSAYKTKTDSHPTQVPDPTIGEVTSRDGTRIGYLRLGHGPGLVLLHGSMETARSHLQLARHLSDTFTVYLPDRRGRGLSGPPGAEHGIRQEVEDLDAVLTATGAHYVFGVSASGLVALEAVRTLPAVNKIAVYEPALLTNPEQNAWLARYDRQMSEGRVAAALVTSMKGLTLGPPILNLMPIRLLVLLTKLAMRSEDKKAADGAPTMRSLAPTLHCEGTLLAEMTGSARQFGTVTEDVLLLSGSKGLRLFLPGMQALEQALPNVRRVEFPGLDHGGSADVSSTNRSAKPDVVGAELRRFFAQP